MAGMTDRYAILRSVTHTGTNHGTSAYHMLTGHLHATPGTLRHPAPSDFPSVGCAVSRFGRRLMDLPVHVALPSVLHDGDGGEVPGQGPGILGQRYAPFYVHGDPTRPDFSIKSLTLPREVDSRRFHERMDLQIALEQAGDLLGRRAAARAMDAPYEQAFRLLQSPAARQAFQLAAEPAAVRERYGWHHFGQSCLLARRLLEAGVPLVTVYWNAPHIDDLQHWDTHKDSFDRLQNHLLPHFDRGMAALLEDLQQRGLLDETLVVWMGEFGRTPKINRQAGRDHWGHVFSVALAGGAGPGGKAIGPSDRTGANPKKAAGKRRAWTARLSTALGMAPIPKFPT